MVHLTVLVRSATVHHSVQLVGIVRVKTRKSIPWSCHVYHSNLVLLTISVRADVYIRQYTIRDDVLIVQARIVSVT